MRGTRGGDHLLRRSTSSASAGAAVGTLLSTPLVLDQSSHATGSYDGYCSIRGNQEPVLPAAVAGAESVLHGYAALRVHANGSRSPVPTQRTAGSTRRGVSVSHQV